MGRLNSLANALLCSLLFAIQACTPAFATITTLDQVKANKVNVDNLQVDGNTISSTSGDLTLDSAGSLLFPDLTATTVPYLNGSKALTSSAVTPTELGYLTGVTSSLCGINQSCTATNKTFTSPTINSGTLNMPTADVISLTEQSSTPSTPSSGTRKFYAKNDGKVYHLNSAGAEVEVGSGSGASGNVLTNASFEDASSLSGWTINTGGGATCTTSTSSVVEDSKEASLKSASCLLVSVNGTIISQSKTITSGGLNFEQGMWVNTSATTLAVCSQVNGSDVQCTDVLSDGAWHYYYATSITVAGQTAGVRLKTKSSTTGSTLADVGYVGTNRQLTQVAQAQILGAATYASTSNCTWTRTSTGSSTMGSFAADSDCPTPTLTGSAQAPATKIPAVKFPSIPAGYLRCIATGGFGKSGSDVTSAQFRFYDGTSGTAPQTVYHGTNTTIGAAVLSGLFYYASGQSNVTIEIQGLVRTTTSSVYLEADNGTEFNISCESIPSQAQLVVKPSLPVLPTVTRLTSGSGTYTPPVGVTHIVVEMVGGGGGGEGSSTNNTGGSGGDGGATTFGTSLLTANGGKGNTSSSAAGGTATVAAPAITIVSMQGAYGQGRSDQTTSAASAGGIGGASPFGGNGAGMACAIAGPAAQTNSGSGGGGAGLTCGTAGNIGGGGGAGGYLKAQINSPSSSGYSYSIGAAGTAGTAGTSGFAGGAGGSGIIIITEYYQGMNAPVFVGGVTSSSTSTTELLNRAQAAVKCTSSPCTISYQTGSWLTSITRASTGVYQANFANTMPLGTTCTCSTSSGPTSCVTSDYTTSKVQLNSFSGTTATDGLIDLVCIGPK